MSAVAPDGRKMLRLEVRNSQTPIERKPEWIKTRAKMGPEYTAAAEAGEERGPAHGLPGGRLSQHLRVLGGPRGDLPHRRRPVHPALRLLPDRHRQARRRSTATSRAGSAESVVTMDLNYATITGVARDDLADGGAWLYAETVRQIHARLRTAPADRRRAADPRLQRDARAARRGLLLPPRGARAQRRDGAADLQADPPRLPLRALARRHHARPATAGLVTKSNLILGMGEEPRGDQPGAAGPARRRLRADHDHAVPAPLRAPPPGRALGEAGGVRGAAARRPRRSASPA